jgi:hypothetical protein
VTFTPYRSINRSLIVTSVTGAADDDALGAANNNALGAADNDALGAANIIITLR